MIIGKFLPAVLRVDGVLERSHVQKHIENAANSEALLDASQILGVGCQRIVWDKFLNMTMISWLILTL